MSFQGADDDIDLEEVTEVDFSISQLANLVRAELLKDVRRKGALFGPKYAQKRAPLISKKTPPQTQRVW